MSENVRVIVRSRPMNKNESNQKVREFLGIPPRPITNSELDSIIAENRKNRWPVREAGECNGHNGAAEELHIRQCVRWCGAHWSHLQRDLLSIGWGQYCEANASEADRWRFIEPEIDKQDVTFL